MLSDRQAGRADQESHANTVDKNVSSTATGGELNPEQILIKYEQIRLSRKIENGDKRSSFSRYPE